MGLTNVEIVRRAYEAWNRTGWSGVRAVFDPEIEIHPPRMWPESEPLRGRENFRRVLEAAVETAEARPSLEVEELLDIGDQVLATVRSRGSGRLSGIYMESSYSMVLALREGRVHRIDFYLTPAEAREAVGLPTGRGPHGR
jgi:ketosteroid isomerase-like protein